MLNLAKKIGMNHFRDQFQRNSLAKGYKDCSNEA